MQLSNRIKTRRITVDIPLEGGGKIGVRQLNFEDSIEIMPEFLDVLGRDFEAIAKGAGEQGQGGQEKEKKEIDPAKLLELLSNNTIDYKRLAAICRKIFTAIVYTWENLVDEEDRTFPYSDENKNILASENGEFIISFVTLAIERLKEQAEAQKKI